MKISRHIGSVVRIALFGWCLAGAPAGGAIIEDAFEAGSVTRTKTRLRQSDVDVGWRANSSQLADEGFPESAWAISGGTLNNTSTLDHVDGEGAVVQLVTVAVDGPLLHLAFDYENTGNDMLYVHLWGFTGFLDGDNDDLGNFQAKDGSYVNLAEDVDGEGNVDTFNLRNGSNPALGSASAALCALQGSGRYECIIRLSDLGIPGVNGVGDFTYLSLAFARDMGSQPGVSRIDNLVLDAGWSDPGTPREEKNYTYLYYQHGQPTPYRTRRSQAEANTQARAEPDLVFQTGYYSLMLDSDQLELKGYDALAGSDYRAALDEPVTVFTPAQGLELKAWRDGVAYVCTNATILDENGSLVRMIESGQYLQRIDHLGLEFRSTNGVLLNEEGRLEISAWPDRVTFLLDFPGDTISPVTRTSIQLVSPSGKTHRVERWGPEARLTLMPHEDVTLGDRDPGLFITEAVDGLGGFPLDVRFDPDTHAFRVVIGSGSVLYPADTNRVDEFLLEVSNPSSRSNNIPLVFVQPSPPAITGTSLLLADADNGRPLGIPVQVSKNWHRQSGSSIIHQGSWLRGSVMLALGPGETRKMRLRVVYGYWGGAGAISHAQLSLIGWGGNWQWEQQALGAWGESITYDSTHHIAGAFMGDIRPAFTTSYTAGNPTHGWTENVGGGDMLIYRDRTNTYHWIKRLKTCFLKTGPNMTEVLYSGITDDERIKVGYSVRAFATRDYHRRFHGYRYEFLQDVVNPRRLVFHQMAADYYLKAQFGTYHIGDAGSFLLPGVSDPGGNRYKGQPIRVDGLWLAVDDTQGGDDPARALRGLIPRRITLNGNPSELYLHRYGRTWGADTMLFDFGLSTPTNSVPAGTVAEGECELVMPPQRLANYWGGDAELAGRLAAYGSAEWEPVRDEFRHNMGIEIAMARGELLAAYPLEIKPETEGDVLADVTVVRGGIGHVPVILRNAPAGLELRAQRWTGSAWVDLEGVDIPGDTYYQANLNGDGSMDYVFTIPRPAADLEASWRIRIIRYRTAIPYQSWAEAGGLGPGDAYAGLEPLVGGGARLLRDDQSLRKNLVSAWEIREGELVNFSTNLSAVAEGAVGRIFNLAFLSTNAGSKLKLEFDYATSSPYEKLHVHLWGYVDVSSTPSTHTLNLEASQGSAWESAKLAMTAYNLGRSDGFFNGIPGVAADAAVILTGFEGEQHFSRIFDVSGIPDTSGTIDGFDYLVIGFARNIRNASAPGVRIKNIALTLPGADGAELWSFRPGLRQDDPDADPDSDLQSNFAEYAFGGDPEDGHDAGYPLRLEQVEHEGTNEFHLIYARRIGADHLLEYRLARTSNLVETAWTEVGYAEFPVTVPLDADFEIVSNRVEDASGPGVYRVEVAPRGD